MKELINADICDELEKIGFDKSYVSAAADKYRYRNIKIYSLTLPQANILKQTALSAGADCALHRDVLINKIDKTDVILGGSKAQLNKIAEKLKKQPFGLQRLCLCLETPQRSTKIAGILNLTDDSFSDGYPDFESAKNRLEELTGSDIIDIGAESTRPGAVPVPAKQQLERILPVLDFLSHIERSEISQRDSSALPHNDVVVSIDTRSSEVAAECIKAGAQIINDVSGLTFDEKMADVIAKSGVKVIIQHTQGTPETMQAAPHYDSVMDEIYLWLHERIRFALSKGIPKENIIIDPGIGFGKKREHNFEIIRRIEEFYGLGCPVMLGISRKAFLNMPDNETKDIFTVALNTLAVEQKVDFIRVHNVKLHRQLVELLKK